MTCKSANDLSKALDFAGAHSGLRDVGGASEHIGERPTDDGGLQIANQLPPSRANFITNRAARQPAEDFLMAALVDAHASIDATEIYTILKTLRYRAGFPTPSLVGVGHGVDELRSLHCRAVIASGPITVAASDTASAK